MFKIINKRYIFNNINLLNKNYSSQTVKNLIKTKEKDYMYPTYNSFQTFKDPVVISKASGQYCYGPDGKIFRPFSS